MKENPFDAPSSGQERNDGTQPRKSGLRIYILLLALSFTLGLLIWNEAMISKLIWPGVGVLFIIALFAIPVIALTATITAAEKRFAGLSGREAVKRGSGFVGLVVVLMFIGAVFFVSSCTGAILFADQMFPAGGRTYGPSTKSWAIALSAGLFFSNVLIYLLYNKIRKRIEY